MPIEYVTYCNFPRDHKWGNPGLCDSIQLKEYILGRGRTRVEEYMPFEFVGESVQVKVTCGQFLEGTVIGMELIRELVETVILTGKIKDVYPVSLLLIASPESGKTSIVLDRPCKSVAVFTDVTGRGIQMILQQKKEITHIVINDLVAVLSHKQTVNKYTISVMNALTEEGISSIATPAGIETFDHGRKGIITSLTSDMANDARNWWNKVGFASRMLPFCYRFPDKLIIEIKDHIDSNGGKHHKVKANPEFKTPEKQVAIEYPDAILKSARRVTDIRSTMLGEQGMRRLKQYHALIQAHALQQGRREVTEADLDFLCKVDLYCSFDTPRDL